MAFGDPVADIGGYGQGFGGPVGPEDEKELSLYEQALAKFGSPFERTIGYITNQGIANLNPAMGLINVLGTAKNLLDAGIEKSPLTGSPDLSLTNPNKSVDDAGVFSGQTLSPSYSGGNIGGFDLGGGRFTSLGTTVGSLTEDAIEEAFPNVQFGIDPNITYGETIDDSMEQNPIMDFADPIGLMADPLGVNLSFNNRVSTKELPAEVEMYGPPAYMDLNFYGIPNPAFDPDTIKNNPQDTWDAIDNMFDPLSNLDDAVFDLDNAIASIGPNAFESAFGTGYSGVSPDMGAVSQEGGGEPLAQRIAETMIAQQAARAPSNNVTIPMSSGPDIVIDVTPPKPQASVAPQRRTAPRPSPVKIAAKSIAKPKAFKKLPKFAQKEIRQGRVPTSGSDNVQDMVRAFLATPEPATPRGQRPPGATR